MKNWFVFCFLVSVVSIQAQETFSPEKLWELKRMNGGDLSPDGQFVLFTQSTYNLQANKGNTDIFLYKVSDRSIQQVTNTPGSEFESKWSRTGEIYFLSGESGSVQLYSINVDGKNKELKSKFLSDIEGYTLSPEEDKIVVIQQVKVAQTIKERHPDLPMANARVEDDLMYRHWNQWSDEFVAHLFLSQKNADGIFQDGTDILKGEKYEGILGPFGGSEGVIFTADGQKVIYVSKKMVGTEFATSTNSELYQYDMVTGKTENLTEGMKGYENVPTITPDGKKLSWLSMARNGFEADRNVLFLYDFASASTKAIKLSQDLTIDNFTWENDGKSFLFVAPFKGVNQLFSADLNGKVTQLTTGKMNVVHFSLGKDKIYMALQSMLAPTDLFVLDRKTKSIDCLTTINAEIMDNLDMPQLEERWIKTTDGKEMLTWVMLPPNFDKNKKYPTLLYCQGGPQSMVSQFFSYRWNLMLMASQGYVIVAPNRRGLPGFGQEWNDQISKDWGGQPIRDYLSAIDELVKEPWVDETKLGAVGASYGGYSVYFLAGVHEKRFKTFISHCGLFNLESWYGMTEELFFANWDIGGPYWLPENKELYAKNSPHKNVDKWDTPIMVIHGGMDFRVPESEGMQAFQAAQLKGLKSRFLYLPTEGHWVQKPQNGVLWHREFYKWLAEDLK